MNAGEIIEALQLPAGARVDLRVPKKLLIENSAPSPGDKRRIREGIEEVRWVASLKPATVGIGGHESSDGSIGEIALLSAVFRPGANAERLTELIHRGIPYPVVLVVGDDKQIGMSLAHKRQSLGDSARVVLDGSVVSATFDEVADNALTDAFLNALPIANQPQTDLLATYRGWLDAVIAVKVARITGKYYIATSRGQAAVRREALEECTQLASEMVRLRAAAAKESQLPRRVELNLELKQAEGEYAAAATRL